MMTDRCAKRARVVCEPVRLYRDRLSAELLPALAGTMLNVLHIYNINLIYSLRYR